MHRLFALMMAAIIALGISGCGGGAGGTSADPLGTDGMMFGHKVDAAGTEWAMAMQVSPLGTVVLTAKITSAYGKAVAGREVSFGFVTNASGAKLNNVPFVTVNTDANGEATLIYTAGLIAGMDVVRASISNGAVGDTNITVSTGGAGGRQIALQGAPTSLRAGQNSVVAATVTDSAGDPVVGEVVSFSFITNLSGAPALIVLNGGLTDGGGQALAVYTAGAGTPNNEVEDAIKAEIPGVGASALILTRTGATTPPGTKTLSLSAGTLTVAAGQSSILTARVVDSTGQPLSGQTVTFQFRGGGAAPSGGSLSGVNGGVTDASGQALAVYTAGSLTPAVAVQDIVEAGITGAAGAIIITRTASTVVPPATYRLTLSAGTSTLAAGESSVVTALVTDTTGTPVNGQTVTFRFLGGGAAPSGGTLTTLNGGVTDASGQALAVYKAGNNSPTTGVQDVIEASITGASGAVIITRTASTVVPPAGLRLSLSADISTLAAGESSILTARVTDATGAAVNGQAVTFRFLGGAAAPSGGSLTTLNGGNTDASGQAVAVYKAGNNAPGTAIQDVVEANITGASGAVVITRTASTAVPPAGYRLVLSAGSTSLAAGQNTILSARVTNQDGAAVSGQVVAFRFVGLSASGGALSAPLNGGVTDASGQVVAVYTAGANTPAAALQDVVEAYIAGTASDAIVITRTAAAAIPAAGYRLTVAADVTSVEAGQSAVVTATVTDGAGSPAGGQAVTFALLTNNSGATITPLNGGVTDVSGRAAAVYTAGAASPTLSVQDTIQAGVAGSAGAIVMTRLAAGGGGAAGVRMTVTAVPTSLNAGALSVIVAEVMNAAGDPVAGLAVTFGFVVNNSGAPALTTVNATTDASGTALATYIAGSNNAGVTVQDAVYASVAGSAGAVILTRLTGAGTGNRILSFTEAPETTATIPLPTTASNCILTVRVTRDDLITPVVNETVSFSIFSGTGTLSALTAQTDTQGDAWVLFTGPGGAGPGETVVRATIPGTTNGGDAARIIYW